MINGDLQNIGIRNLISEMEEGVSTITGSSGLNFVVSMKKVSNRKATSHMAVMSIDVLFLGIFTFGMV